MINCMCSVAAMDRVTCKTGVFGGAFTNCKAVPAKTLNFGTDETWQRFCRSGGKEKER